jgi:hypothetical protein
MSSPRLNSHVEYAAVEAVSDTCVVQQFARMLRYSTGREVGRRSRRDEMLNARADRHRDHVALEAFVVADAGIKTRREDIDERVVGPDVHRDTRVSGKEAGEESGQDFSGCNRRNVQPQRSGRTFTKEVHRIQRDGDFPESRREPLEETLSCLCWRDAARRTIEQSDTELLFEPSNRFAKR